MHFMFELTSNQNGINTRNQQNGYVTILYFRWLCWTRFQNSGNDPGILYVGTDFVSQDTSTKCFQWSNYQKKLCLNFIGLQCFIIDDRKNNDINFMNWMNPKCFYGNSIQKPEIFSILAGLWTCRNHIKKFGIILKLG